MDCRTIRHKIRDLRKRLYILQRDTMERMYDTDCGYEHPSVQPKVAEALLIDQIIEGYLILLRQPLSLEVEDILPSDVPQETK